MTLPAAMALISLPSPALMNKPFQLGPSPRLLPNFARISPLTGNLNCPFRRSNSPAGGASDFACFGGGSSASIAFGFGFLPAFLSSAACFALSFAPQFFPGAVSLPVPRAVYRLSTALLSVDSDVRQDYSVFVHLFADYLPVFLCVEFV
jgi:hypothetical protein